MTKKTYDNRLVLVGACAIDWITVTSWDVMDLSVHGENMLDALGKGDNGQIMQYEGTWAGEKSGFYGVGQQKQKGEYYANAYLKVSGFNAKDWYFLMGEDGFNTSRVDPQITIEIEQPFDMSRVCANLRDKGVKCGVYSDRYSDGTLYIGSKGSERFGRVYMKDTRQGMCLRCEMQLGKQYSNQFALYGSQMPQSQAVGVALRWLWRKLPKSDVEIFDFGVDRCRYIANMSANGAEFGGIVKEQEHDTLKWLETLVYKAIENVHAKGDETDNKRLKAIIEAYGEIVN